MQRFFIKFFSISLLTFSVFSMIDCGIEEKETRTVGYYSLLQKIGDYLYEDKTVDCNLVDRVASYYIEPNQIKSELTRLINVEDVGDFAMGYSKESKITHQFVNDINDRIKCNNISQKNVDKMLSDWAYFCQFWLDDD